MPSLHVICIACLALATSQLGSIGAWQSGLLFGSYTLSALLGATYVVKKLGSKNGLVLGMALYCVYVGCFVFAIHSNNNGRHDDNDNQNENNDRQQRLAAYAGAVIGGIGAGFLWTAQGTYFSQASKHYDEVSASTNAQLYSTGNEDQNSNMLLSSSPSTAHSDHTTNSSYSSSTSLLAGIFAFWYLIGEVILRLIATILLEYEWVNSWHTVFRIYTIIAILSTILMKCCVHDYSNNDLSSASFATSTTSNAEPRSPSRSSFFYKITAAIQLFRQDPKMKYMVGLNAIFGFTSAFVNTYVNGEVLPQVLQDPESKFVGMYTSWSAVVAAVMSLVFISTSISSPPSTLQTTKNESKNNKGRILILGVVCFMGIAIPFILLPDVTNQRYWDWKLLLLIYSFQGIGRSTFEGTLKATFVDFFPHESEGSFANIIVQSGLSNAVGSICKYTECFVLY